MTTESPETLNGGSLHRIVVLLRGLDEEQQQMEKRRGVVWREAGEQMREARETSKISLREAAKRMGITAPYLSDMELGRRQPSVKWLEKLQHVIKQHNDRTERPEAK